ncbi:MAG TPA: serine protease [Kiritimatiellia bacterium]|nr:serine protease [Kiritimatiellia bacterium]HMO99517.1 serine protease [Kiritimatiellia bacterium]HMP97573.1 serine protease [Kiritimatiellia bacterium]
MRIKKLLVLLLVGAAVLPVSARESIQDAIVKIYTSSSVPDYYNPWAMLSSTQGTGSGCIIAGRKILSNAHVVSYQTFVQVRKHGDARRYTARVVSVSHTADLAILTVDDPDFFEGVTPLELGELPEAQDEVLVYGFPLGGDVLSITKGVISRIEHQVYAHSSVPLLAGQIDAAINPGNSGGPVLMDGKIAGVVMQGMTQADNIGYMVPVNIVEHFFADLEDGEYDGIPSLGVIMQNLENPALKRRSGMDDDRTGLLINQVLPGAPAEGVLMSGDVLLSVDGHPVADDGTVEFRPRQRTSASYFIQRRHVGDDLAVEVWRDGRVVPLSVSLNRPLWRDWLIPLDEYDVLPSYYVYGGAVMVPLTKNLLKRWGGNWFRNAPPDLVARLGENIPEREDQQVVMILKFLPADVNQGYHQIANWIIKEVNDQPVNNLRDVIVRIEEDPGDFVELKSSGGHVVVLDRELAEASHESILRIYRVGADRSPDLLP